MGYSSPVTLATSGVRGAGGEGAGYAGGILSAGVDGIKLAEAVALDIRGAPAWQAAAGPARLRQARA